MKKSKSIKIGQETDDFLSGYYDSSGSTEDSIGYNQGVETEGVNTPTEYSIGVPLHQKNRVQDILNSGMCSGPKPYNDLKARGKSSVSIKYRTEPASEGFFNIYFQGIDRNTFYKIVTRLDMQGIETIGADTELTGLNEYKMKDKIKTFIKQEINSLFEMHIGPDGKLSGFKPELPLKTHGHLQVFEDLNVGDTFFFNFGRMGIAKFEKTIDGEGMIVDIGTFKFPEGSRTQPKVGDTFSFSNVAKVHSSKDSAELFTPGLNEKSE